MNRLKYYQKEAFIYPEDKDGVKFWLKKWHITSSQLNEAILETGSIHVKEIKNYLIKSGYIFYFLKPTNYLKRYLLKKTAKFSNHQLSNNYQIAKTEKVIWLRMPN